MDDENIYEEINEVERRLALDKVFPGDTSLVDEVLDEVERVRQRHDTVLNQLNLDLENFLNPHTPETPPASPRLDQLDANGIIPTSSHHGTVTVNEAINEVVSNTVNEDVKEDVKDSGNYSIRNRCVLW